MTKLEALLRASIEIAEKNKRIAELEEENQSLRRCVEGDFEAIAADCMFFRRQAE